MSQGVPIDRIHVGERLDPRRKSLNIPALAASIEKHGLINLITVTPNPDRAGPQWLLVCGERRLEAVKLLGWTHVHIRAVTAKEAVALLEIEWAENAEREPPTASMRVRYARKILELESAAAAERQRDGQRSGGAKGGRGRIASGTADPEAVEPANGGGDEDGRALTRAAKAAGFSSRKALERAAKVYDAGEVDPMRFGGLVAEMDRTGKPAAVAAKLERMEEGSDPDSWCTPSWVLELVHAVEEHGITLDPCSNANAIALGYVKASTSWTIDDDALAQRTWDLEPGWTAVWYQPPYSSPGPLTERCVVEYDKGVRRVWSLVKLDTSTGWWGQLRDRAPILILPRRRLAHVVGDKPRKGSDFCSGMLLLTRERGAELLELHQRVQAACGDKADAYLAPWALAELLDVAAKAANDEPAPPAKPRKRAKR